MIPMALIVQLAQLEAQHKVSWMDMKYLHVVSIVESFIALLIFDDNSFAFSIM